MMFTAMVGTGLLTAVLLAGGIPFQVDVPAPVPKPGPGPTVPPKPSDPVPTPPTTPKYVPYTWRERTSPTQTADSSSRHQEAVSGTLMQLDLVKKEGRLGTDLGREVLFHIPKPELFAQVSVGQRITIKLDARQQAIAVMETAAPELPHPSPSQ